MPLAKRLRPKLNGLKVAWYADDGIAKPTRATAAAVQGGVKALADGRLHASPRRGRQASTRPAR